MGLSGRFHKHGYESEDPSPTLPVDGEGELPPRQRGDQREVLWGQPIRSVKAGHPQYVTVFRNGTLSADPKVLFAAQALSEVLHRGYLIHRETFVIGVHVMSEEKKEIFSKYGASWCPDAKNAQGVSLMRTTSGQ